MVIIIKKEYTPYFYDGKTMLINRFLTLHSGEFNPRKYDIYDYQYLEFRALTEKDYSLYPVFDKLDFGFYNQIEQAGTKTLLYTEVFCERDSEVILNFCCSKGGKLFVNGRIAAIHNRDWNLTSYITVKFKAGRNILLLEIVCITGEEVFSLQIRDSFAEREGGDPVFSLCNTPESESLDGVTLVSGTDYLPADEIYSFMYIPNTWDLYQDVYEIEIEDSATGFVRKMQGRFYEPVYIPLKEFREMHPEHMRFESIRCHFMRKDGSKISDDRSIIVNPYENEANDIYRSCMKLVPKLPPFIADQLIGRAEKLNVEYDTGSASFWVAWNLCYLQSEIESGRYYDRYYTGSGTHEVYLRSVIDDSLVRVMVNIPAEYDPRQEYPLIISIATSQYGENSLVFPVNKLQEPVIHVDVSGRGFTLGSYIAEASILDLLDFVRKTYRINEDRMYAIGFSSGGYAAFALAQNHPGLFAAIFPLGSFPDLSYTQNLSHTEIFNIVSDMDNVYRGRCGEVKKAFGKYGNYHEFGVKEHIHNQLCPYRMSPYILNRMLCCKRDPFPKELRFKTSRTRHGANHWVSVHGICEGKRSASFTADFDGAQNIRVNVKNAKGVTVFLPPSTNRKCFNLFLNDKKYKFCDYNRDRICFSHTGKGYTMTYDPSAGDVSKGTGLLDVYLTPMRILLPNNSNKESKILAAQFAQPKTNGFSPVIHTNYPVFKGAGDISCQWAYSWVLLDNGSGNKIIDELRDSLSVKTDAEGFSYGGVYYAGDYCVMQICKNPINKEKSNLIIQWNNDDLVKNHILLRRVTMPSYLFGIHPYWNNNILILYNESYYAAYENDADLGLISK